MAYKRKMSSGYKKRGARKRPYRKATTTGRRRLMTLIKKAVIKKAEPKEKSVLFGKKELYHNSFYDPLGVQGGLVLLLNSGNVLPTQGVGDNQRVGDQINMTGWKLRMLIGQKSDRPNVSFAYHVLGVPKGSTITYGNWFNFSQTNVLLAEPNRDFVTTYGAGLWRPNEAGLAGSGGDEYTFVKKLWIPYRKVLKFGPADAAVTHNDQDIYFIVMAYDAYGSLASDNIAYIETQCSFFYRDP